VLLSTDLLERSHNNFLVVELWERRFTADRDLLIGVAKLPLNKFFIAYRDPIVAAQLLLSKVSIFMFHVPSSRFWLE
jgi:C2 domain-containing protein 3